MSYTVITDSMIDVDSPFDETLAAAYRNNIRELRFVPFCVQQAITTTTATSAATVGSFSIYIPSFSDESGWTRQIVLELEAKNSSTSYITTFQIQDQGTTTNGTSATTSSSSFVSVTSTLTVASTWAGTTRTINLRLATNNASGSATIQSTNRITGRMWY